MSTNTRVFMIVFGIIGIGCLGWYFYQRYRAEQVMDEMREVMANMQLADTGFKPADEVRSRPRVDDFNRSADSLKRYIDMLTDSAHVIGRKVGFYSGDYSGFRKFFLESGRATKLRHRMERLSAMGQEICTITAANSIKEKLATDSLMRDGKLVSWEEYYFTAMPPAGLFGFLDRLRDNVRVSKQYVRQ